MIVGFTGTRQRMSDTQIRQLGFVLKILPEPLLLHGGAIGADLQAHQVAVSLDIDTMIYPANGDPLKRNRQIAADCDLLIAAPLTDQEELRSGTWATVRYVRKERKPIIFLSRGPS